MSAVAGDERHEDPANGITHENGVVHHEDIPEPVLASKEAVQPVVEEETIPVAKPVTAEEPSEVTSGATVEDTLKKEDESVAAEVRCHCPHRCAELVSHIEDVSGQTTHETSNDKVSLKEEDLSKATHEIVHEEVTDTKEPAQPAPASHVEAPAAAEAEESVPAASEEPAAPTVATTEEVRVFITYTTRLPTDKPL